MNLYPILLTPDETAGIVGIDAKRVRELMRTGRINSIRVGNEYRTRMQDITAWLDYEFNRVEYNEDDHIKPVRPQVNEAERAVSRILRKGKS